VTVQLSERDRQPAGSATVARLRPEVSDLKLCLDLVADCRPLGHQPSAPGYRHNGRRELECSDAYHMLTLRRATDRTVGAAGQQRVRKTLSRLQELFAFPVRGGAVTVASRTVIIGYETGLDQAVLLIPGAVGCR
jgi:hypothetical protein